MLEILDRGRANIRIFGARDLEATRLGKPLQRTPKTFRELAIPPLRLAAFHIFDLMPRCHLVSTNEPPTGASDPRRMKRVGGWW
jgi:hypothetical protein